MTRIKWNLTLLRRVAFALLFFHVVPLQASPRYYDLMLFDFPYTTLTTTRIPSTQQSLTWGNSFYEFGHQNIAETLIESPRSSAVAAIAFDIASIYMPLGNSWLHEEWHRAVLGRYDIGSYNGIYYFSASDTIPVDHVSDENLAWLKLNHPTDFIRLHSAGFEAQLEQNFQLEKQLFFMNTGNRHQFLFLLNTLNSIAYIYTCGSDRGTRSTKQIIANEGTDINIRDFTGFDCTAWVYDLYRPDESYYARGTHPSGVGVNRYRTLDDLTSDERHFLKTQFYLSLINLIDPLQFNFRSFGWHIGEKSGVWNANARHYLAPFGYSIATSLFLRSDEYKVLSTLNFYVNRNRVFPGFEIEWFDLDTNIGTTLLRNRVRVGIWQQPDQLRFDTNDADTGGYANIRAELNPNSYWSPYIEAEYKSEGWLAGEVYLDRKLAFRLGFEYRR